VQEFVCKNFVNCKNKKLPLIRRGIDFDYYKNIKSDNSIENKFKHKTKFVFIGRLYKWKGVENSIKAIKLLPEQIKKRIVFFIVGYGEDLNRLKKLAGTELNKSIIFLGKKDFKQSIPTFKSCDCYIHSAYPGGGLSNSLLQALYLKKWVIASPNEGAKEVIVNNKNGYLLKDNNPNKIKENILKYLNKKSKVDKKTYSKFKKDFDWSKIVEEYKQVL